MRKIRRHFFAGALVCALLCMGSVGAMAASFSYSTTTLKDYMIVANDTAVTRTLSVNTQPSEGSAGAYVRIRKSDGTFTAKTFPKQVPVDPLTTAVKSGEFRHIDVGPAGSGETVSGTLNYNMY